MTKQHQALEKELMKKVYLYHILDRKRPPQIEYRKIEIVYPPMLLQFITKLLNKQRIELEKKYNIKK